MIQIHSGSEATLDWFLLLVVALLTGQCYIPTCPEYFQRTILVFSLEGVNDYFEDKLKYLIPTEIDMSGAKQLGEYVKWVMKLKGLTQKDVQRLSGWQITDGYVASITTGRAGNLSVEKLKALADGLGVDLDDLFHVASGLTPKPDEKNAAAIDPLVILDTVQKAVASPDVTEILHEVVRLSSDERASLLAFIKRMGTTKRKTRRRAKLD